MPRLVAGHIFVRYMWGCFIVWCLLAASGATWAQQAEIPAPPPREGMDQGEFVAVVVGSLEFHSTIGLLILGAYGFAIGRRWPETSNRPMPRTLKRFAPGIVIVAVALVLVGVEYVRLAGAISGNSLVTYAASWGGKIWLVEGFEALSVLALFVAIGTGD